MSKLIMAEIQTQSKSLRELREELQAHVDESMFKEFLKVYVSRNSGFIGLDAAHSLRFINRVKAYRGIYKKLFEQTLSIIDIYNYKVRKQTLHLESDDSARLYSNTWFGSDSRL